MEKQIALTSIQRDRAQWIVEWIAFHMLVGFNRFYIYSHKCSDGMTDILTRLAAKYPIVVHPIESDDPPQLVCYQHAYNAYGGDVDWMAYIDGDEFLFPTAATTIGQALEEYEKLSLSSVAAYWMCYGSSGHLMEPSGLILENYKRHSGPDFLPNRHLKSIIKGRLEGVKATTSHVFTTPGGTFDENGRPVNFGWMKQYEPTYAKFRINHYMVQSYQFFIEKKQKMGAADIDLSYVRSLDWFMKNDRNEYDDGFIYNYLLPLKLKVQELENFLKSTGG